MPRPTGCGSRFRPVRRSPSTAPPHVRWMWCRAAVTDGIWELRSRKCGSMASLLDLTNDVFGPGFHELEQDTCTAWRWTDGRAQLASRSRPPRDGRDRRRHDHARLDTSPRPACASSKRAEVRLKIWLRRISGNPILVALMPKFENGSVDDAAPEQTSQSDTYHRFGYIDPLFVISHETADHPA